MNLKKLHEAESLFLLQYPQGFASEEMQAIRKRHNVGRLSEFAATALTRKSFTNQAQVLDDIVKIVTRSSMVSMFEKPKFRDYVNGLARDDRNYLCAGYKRLLHGNQERGFQDARCTQRGKTGEVESDDHRHAALSTADGSVRKTDHDQERDPTVRTGGLVYNRAQLGILQATETRSTR